VLRASTVVAPASNAFSTSSFTALARSSTTWHAAWKRQACSAGAAP
jgi:hypothetical protein